jgi:hypothetical protein
MLGYSGQSTQVSIEFDYEETKSRHLRSDVDKLSLDRNSLGFYCRGDSKENKTAQLQRSEN